MYYSWCIVDLCSNSRVFFFIVVKVMILFYIENEGGRGGVNNIIFIILDISKWCVKFLVRGFLLVF